MERTGLNHRQISEKIGVSISTINALKLGRAKPSFDVCRDLLLAGMSVEELFGTDVAKNVQVSSEQKKELPPTIDHDRFVAGVKAALAELVKAPKFPGMKE